MILLRVRSQYVTKGKAMKLNNPMKSKAMITQLGNATGQEEWVPMASGGQVLIGFNPRSAWWSVLRWASGGSLVEVDDLALHAACPSRSGLLKIVQRCLVGFDPGI